MSQTPSTNKTVLGPDCRISGELSLDNDAVIMGQFQGTLRVSGVLELADSAEVAGTVIAGTLRLAGHAKADVIAEDGVQLLPGGQLTGQLYTTKLDVVEGATFQGDVCVGPKAIEVAIDALNLDADTAAPAPAPAAMPMAAPAMDDMDDDFTDEPAHDAPEVQTVPGSVNKILQRRRARVISSRNGAGNGVGAH
ncbi:MAG: polymer-forming cytoskeletal protein [Planctomycetota bacterium]